MEAVITVLQLAAASAAAPAELRIFLAAAATAAAPMAAVMPAFLGTAATGLPASLEAKAVALELQADSEAVISAE